MDALEAIRTRRSVSQVSRPAGGRRTRRTTSRGRHARPDARNQQPWQFVVIDDRADPGRGRRVHSERPDGRTMPLGILVCGDLALETSPGYWVVDCAGPRKHAPGRPCLGIWAPFGRRLPPPAANGRAPALIGLPENVIAHSLVVLGHPAEQVPAPENRYQARSGASEPLVIGRAAPNSRRSTGRRMPTVAHRILPGRNLLVFSCRRQ